MNNDGRVILELSPDHMLAKATFTPALPDGHAMTQEDVDYELRAAGIVDGILWDVIQASLKECNDHGHTVRSVIIARGVHPRPAMPTVLVFPPKLQQLDPVFLPPELQEQNAALSTFFVPASARVSQGDQVKDVGAVDEHGNIDFRETHGVFVINEGQVLAAVRPPIEGIPGKSVRGEYIPFQTLVVNPMNPGANVELRDSRAYAAKNGRLVWNSQSFWVDETLELAIDVGYKTGNIRFPGNLILKAGIKDRFKVWVGGNLDANGVIDAYEVFCGKDMVAKAGIIGRGKGLVRVRGTLTARFIENAKVECLGPILIENTCLHGSLFSEDTIKTGDKGKLVGGETHALHGIEVNNLGNAAGTHTEVVLGEDYVSHRKLEFSRGKYQELMLMVQEIDQRLSSHGASTNDLPKSLQDQRTRLHDEALKYQELMSAAAEEIKDDFGAMLKVSGTCFPGVRISICGTTLEITKEQKNVMFSLDREKGKIAVTSLTQAKSK